MPGNEAAENRTRDLLIASPAPWPPQIRATVTKFDTRDGLFGFDKKIIGEGYGAKKKPGRCELCSVSGRLVLSVQWRLLRYRQRASKHPDVFVKQTRHPSRRQKLGDCSRFPEPA